MVGMIAIDAWKISRLQEQNNLKIKEYSDILAADMIDTTKRLQENTIATNIDVAADTATASSISLLTSPASTTHTNIILADRK